MTTIKAGIHTLLDSAATVKAASSIKTRSTSMRRDIHIALLSALYIAEQDKQSRPLQLVCAAVDPALAGKIKTWLEHNTVYSMTVKPAKADKPRSVSVAYSTEQAETAHSMLSAAGRDALAACAWYDYKPASAGHEAFTVKLFMEKLAKTIKGKKLNSKQTRALASALQTFGAELSVVHVPRASAQADQSRRPAQGADDAIIRQQTSIASRNTTGKQRARKASAGASISEQIAALEALQVSEQQQAASH